MWTKGEPVKKTALRSLINNKPARALAAATCLVFAATLFSGCVPLASRQAEPGVIVCDIFHAPTDETIKREGFASRIKRMTEQINTAGDSQARAMLHVRLATLKMDIRNPGRNYAQAGRHIDFYLDITEDIGCVDTARNIRGILKRLESLSNSKTKQLIGQVKQLSDDLSSCRESYATCNETVRRLQEIELDMERKRRTIR